MKKVISVLLLVMILSSLLVSTAYACSDCFTNAQVYFSPGVCTGDGVRIRSCHNTSDPNNIGGLAYRGDICNTQWLWPKGYVTSSSWYWTSFPYVGDSGTNGWVSASYISVQ